MDYSREQRRDGGRSSWGTWARARSIVMLALIGAAPAAAPGQQPPAAPALVFDAVTVVDVEQGQLVPDQRVVITGTRIQAIGAVRSVKPPPGARVVAARGQYLIPGL